jgi:hypothetical protein
MRRTCRRDRAAHRRHAGRLPLRARPAAGRCGMTWLGTPEVPINVAHTLSFTGRAKGSSKRTRSTATCTRCSPRRLEIWRLSNFELERRPSPQDVHAVLRRGAQQPGRPPAFCAGRDPRSGRRVRPGQRREFLPAHRTHRAAGHGRHAHRAVAFYARDRPMANRLVLDVDAPWTLSAADVEALARRFAPHGRPCRAGKAGHQGAHSRRGRARRAARCGAQVRGRRSFDPGQ